MLSFLKNHPFAVEAFSESSLVLTFAVPREAVQSMIPPCVTLDTFKDRWAFIAVAIVQTKRLRPKGFPAFLGNDFLLTGYRIFVRYTNNAGKRLRGLYILQSETDKKGMEWLGSLFTHYKYITTPLNYKQHGDRVEVSSPSGLIIEVPLNNENIDLPPGSPFADWKEARRFAGPLPFTFTFNEKKNEVIIVEGVREHWQPAPVSVEKYTIPFIESLHLPEIKLASAFIIKNIPYYWKKGRIEKWNG